MSVALCPILEDNCVSIYTEKRVLVGCWNFTNGKGKPNVYVSGTNVVVQYKDGCREVYHHDDNGNYIGVDYY